jgi:hypothetical protein
VMVYVRESRASTLSAGTHETHDRRRQRLEDSTCWLYMVRQVQQTLTKTETTLDDVLSSLIWVSVGRSRANCYSSARSASVIAIASGCRVAPLGSRIKVDRLRRSICCLQLCYIVVEESKCLRSMSIANDEDLVVVLMG